MRLLPRPFARFAHLFAMASAIVLSSCATTPLPPSMQHPLLNQQGPAFEATSLDNRSITVPSYGTARVTVIDFWASWCGSCRHTMPTLERLWRTQRSSGLMVVGMNLDEDAQQALEGAYSFGITFPVVHDRGQELQAAFGVYQIPTTFVLDAAGRVRFVGRDPESIKRAVSALMDR